MSWKDNSIKKIIREEFVIKKRKVYFLNIAILVSFLTQAQLAEKKGYIGFKTSYGFVDTSFYTNYGITGEYIFRNKIGLVYNLEYQRRTDKFNNIHASVGTLAGPPLILIGLLSEISSSNDNSSIGSVFGLGYLGVLVGLLITVLPDGLSYHIPFGYNGDIAPYANVLGIDYVWNTNLGYSQWKYSCSFGVKGTYWNQSNWMLQGFLESRKVANSGWGFGVGLGLSYSLGSQRKD
ncbi:MAG: hypothetical protein FJX84_06625 [Bacteroidetes bacterium]|nr:hypothetical protein [Bacteroidota bacterium]